MQVVASALAAVTATIAGSFLGVNGTVIGAGVASVLTVTANAIYAHSLQRTGERVRTVAPRRIPSPVDGNRRPASTAVTRPASPRAASHRWRGFGLATAGVFVAMLALLTAVEVISGRPVSDLLRGTSGSGTTVFGADGRGANTPAPDVTVTRTVVPRIVTQTPTVTQTAPAVTVIPTPSAPASTATPSDSATSSGPATSPASSSPGQAP